MANKLADARRSLARAKDAAKKRLEELDVERREIKASLKSLDAAMKALGRGVNKKSTGPRRVDTRDEEHGVTEDLA